MTNIKDLKIYIVEYSQDTAKVFKNMFNKEKQVTVINDDLMRFFKTHQDEIDCLVSPANAFGHMDGGFDARLSDILGWDFQIKVQNYIKEHFHGEQPVATSFIIKTHLPHLSLIHTPTMRYPSRIDDYQVIYQCTIATIKCALLNNIKCLVLPVFGGSCGGVPAEVASEKMLEAYLSFKK